MQVVATVGVEVRSRNKVVEVLAVVACEEQPVQLGAGLRVWADVVGSPLQQRHEDVDGVVAVLVGFGADEVEQFREGDRGLVETVMGVVDGAGGLRIALPGGVEQRLQEPAAACGTAQGEAAQDPGVAVRGRRPD